MPASGSCPESVCAWVVPPFGGPTDKLAPNCELGSTAVVIGPVAALASAADVADDLVFPAFHEGASFCVGVLGSGFEPRFNVIMIRRKRTKPKSPPATQFGSSLTRRMWFQSSFASQSKRRASLV